MPLAHIAMEHDWDAAQGEGDARDAVLEVDGEVVATCDHHGPPVMLHR